MRNGWIVAIFLLLAAAGCNPSKNKVLLDNGFLALQARQYDRAEEYADQYLRAQPKGEGAAEAMYLKGRSFEQRDAIDPGQATTNLQAARSAYVAALGMSPSPKLEAYIRASLGNVAFYQDDYGTAVQQLSLALPQLDNADVHGFALYRIGLSQQRMGKFADADRTFTSVLSGYPGTSAAREARERIGARGFAVQLAAYSSPATAQSQAAELKRRGLPATVSTNPRGLHVLKIGPYGNYEQARSARGRVAQKFPDAKIIP